MKIIEKPRVEGSEQNLVEKEKEKSENMIKSQEVVSGADLLERLSLAAKKGGLPKDSPCSEEYQVTKVSSNKYKPVIIPQTPKINFGNLNTGINFHQFEKTDYIYKPFSIGISNFDSYDLNGLKWSYDLILSSTAKLASRGRVVENTFSYLPKNGNLKFGAGYQYMDFTSLKKVIALPIGFVWGIEGKYYSLIDQFNNSYATYYAAVPVGLKGLMDFGGIHVSPDFTMHYVLIPAKGEKNAGVKATYYSLGGTVRWKFIYAGAYYNNGAKDYLNVKAGVTF